MICSETWLTDKVLWVCATVNSHFTYLACSALAYAFGFCWRRERPLPLAQKFIITHCLGQTDVGAFLLLRALQSQGSHDFLAVSHLYFLFSHAGQ